MANPDVASAGPEPVIESRNPATGEILGTVPVHDQAAVRARVARARQAAAQWGVMSFAERRAELDRFRRALAERADELAELIHRENGKPYLDGLIEVALALGHLAHASSRAEVALAPRKVSPGVLANYRTVVRYHPLGVIGVIGPWNYPIYTPIGSISSALAAGNAVVFKPSELTPLVGQAIASIAADSIGVPDLVQTVTGYGATGAALVGAGVDKISFTGSTATGRKIMAAAAETLTPVLLELGGKDALVVAADADIGRAAEAAVFGAFTNTGQTCISIERAYVAAPIYDRFVDQVTELTRGIRVGSDGDVGAMTRPEQIDIVRGHIRDALAQGARALVGGPDAVDGSFLSPTVLVDVTDDMVVMREETFGPVLPIVKVADVDEGIRRANALPYGLGSAVFAGERAVELAEQMRAGMTAINSVLAYAAIPTLPFGGVGESGIGRIHGDEGLREFARVQATAEERFGLPQALNLLSFGQSKSAVDGVRTLIRQLYGGGAVDRMGTLLGKLRRPR
ncbi:aldehyde dehydrogenase family protein [Haliangium sp.]|uniref:aldehyde dehydrogenase family protein n=1 Tax=Haliangium sp. TaxID=2663208 RepID=UPI003D0BF367